MGVSLYGNYRTRKFTDLWEDYTSFKDAWEDCPFYSANYISNDNLEIIYYLLYSKYGNSHLANSDENQWKYRLFATIWTYAPTYIRRLEIQATLRSLTEADIVEGTKRVDDHAYNPSTIPEGPNVVDGEIQSVNEQVKSKLKKSKAEGYAALIPFLKDDIVENFLEKFRALFLIVVEPQEPLWYESDEEED